MSKKSKLFYVPGHVPSSKNSRAFNVARKRSFASQSANRYYKESESYWEEIKNEFLTRRPESGPIHIAFHFVRKTAHKYDFINPLQTVQDRMVKFGLLEDDNMDELVPHPLKIDGAYSTVDSKNAGVYFKIL